MINLPRYPFIIAALLVFILSTPIVNAKHVIVIYDVSGSMVSLGSRRYMESEDIRRVNTYLAELLFENTSPTLLNSSKDEIIRKCDPAYVGRRLYETGDVLTYAEYDVDREEKISRRLIGRAEFENYLPDPTNLKASFSGAYSYLGRAKVEVYDELYRETDDKTYWVFVTDGDIDHSEQKYPEPSKFERRLLQIEDEFHDPVIVGIRVNNRVKIVVRRIQRRKTIESIFIKRSEEIEKIQFTEVDKEQRLISEPLTIDTESDEKVKFKLESINIEVSDKSGRPLQIADENNNIANLRINPVLREGQPPPFRFQILFPAEPELAALDNLLELQVTYNYEGVDRVDSLGPIGYTPRIESIYVTGGNDFPQQEEQPTTSNERGWRSVEPLELLLSEDTYIGKLVIHSESQNKEAFQINQIQCYIQDKDGLKLFDANVLTLPKALKQQFQVAVPKENRLDWYGNRLVLEIDYQYEGVAKSTTVPIPFNLRRNESFPMWLLIILGAGLLLVGLFFVIRWAKGWMTPDPVEIRLAQVDATGVLLPGSVEQDFTLTHKTILGFGLGDATEHFDVGSWALLRCDQGKIQLYVDASAEESETLRPEQTLTLSRDDGEEVFVRFQIVDDELHAASDDTAEKPGEDQPLPY